MARLSRKFPHWLQFDLTRPSLVESSAECSDLICRDLTEPLSPYKQPDKGRAAFQAGVENALRLASG